jgi:hypothetical protein
MGCCGGKDSMGASRSLDAPQPEGVRLEYTGNKVGAITFNVNGRRYRVGNNARHRFIYVKHDAVERLLKYGVFKLVLEEESNESNESNDTGDSGSASDVSHSSHDSA